MFTSPFSAAAPRTQAAGAYAQVGFQTSVSGATPHQLVSLLFEGFFSAINRAKGARRAGDVGAMSVAVSHAARIVDEGLRASLDVTNGGQLAVDLRDLYGYVGMRLMRANLHADEEALDECARLLKPLQEAWLAIGAAAAAPGKGARS